ncbi:MAG: hypothetical protein WB791_09245 [Waddliaceae bacterium]
MMKRNGCLLILLALSFFPVYDLCSTEVACEGGAYYARQRSCPSKSTFCGWGQRAQFAYRKQYRNFGQTDRLYLAQGTLSGSDPFDDRVKIHYREMDGECWLTYCCRQGNWQIAPLLGFGVYLRWEKRVKPFTCHLDTNFLYIPFGVQIHYSFLNHFSVGAQFKADFMAFTWWRYRHSLLSSKFHQLQRRVGCEVKGWLCYDFSSRWSVALTPAFRYLDLHYPSRMAWSPEEKHLFYYGINIGVVYCY